MCSITLWFLCFYIVLLGENILSIFGFTLSLTFFFLWNEASKNYQATETQANREWCVVKLKQFQSIIYFVPTMLKTHSKWTLRATEQRTE